MSWLAFKLSSVERIMDVEGIDGKHLRKQKPSYSDTRLKYSDRYDIRTQTY